jgi:hypothetical protein
MTIVRHESSSKLIKLLLLGGVATALIVVPADIEGSHPGIAWQSALAKNDGGQGGGGGNGGGNGKGQGGEHGVAVAQAKAMASDMAMAIGAALTVPIPRPTAALASSWVRSAVAKTPRCATSA